MIRGNPLRILVRFAIPLILVALLLGEATSAEVQASIEYLSVISTLFVFRGSLMIFRNTVQGMGYAAGILASAVMEISGRSAA